MRSVIQKDEAAVSPVIATILMVAITVVLAAVLYVMVSGLITPVGGNKPLVTFSP
ncbi:MAG: type IV pilin, partial [Methanobacteriota archaeon]